MYLKRDLTSNFVCHQACCNHCPSAQLYVNIAGKDGWPDRTRTDIFRDIRHVQDIKAILICILCPMSDRFVIATPGYLRHHINHKMTDILLLFQTILNKKEISNGFGPQVLPTLVNRVVQVFTFFIFKHIFHYLHVYKCVRLSLCIS